MAERPTSESPFGRLVETMSPAARRLAALNTFGDQLLYGRLQMSRDGSWTWEELRASDLPIPTNNGDET